MWYVAQFVKNYDKNTKESYIVLEDGQQKRFSLNIDVVQNAYNLPIVATSYVDLRNLT